MLKLCVLLIVIYTRMSVVFILFILFLQFSYVYLTFVPMTVHFEFMYYFMMYFNEHKTLVNIYILRNISNTSLNR